MKYQNNCFKFLLIIAIFEAGSLSGQDLISESFPSVLVSNDKNVLSFHGSSEKQFTLFYRSLDTLTLKGKGIINLVHIGDSHIQAGFLTQEVRKDMTDLFSGGTGSRGLIFPYKVAKSNGPPDYSVAFTGKWEHCRNAEQHKNCTLGLTGFFIRTSDSLTDISIRFREGYLKYDYNRLRILIEENNNSFEIDITDNPGSFDKVNNVPNGISEFRSGKFLDSVHLRITRKDTLNKYFTLYGIDLENGDDGIVYHSLGVNGASVESFLRCSLFEKDLKMLNPGFIIVSLGTNDASMSRFDQKQFEADYLTFLQRVRKVAPDAAILLTVPGDFYRKRRYDNKHLPDVLSSIVSVAEKADCAVWDLYSVMGGSKSIMNWYKAGLVSRDKLHLSRSGYVLQGKMLFNAIYQSYLDNIEIRQEKKPE
jgi:lysophospholipase L1-like esterase